MEWFIITGIIFIFIIIGLIILYDSLTVKEKRNINNQTAKKRVNNKIKQTSQTNTKTIKKLSEDEKNELISNTKEIVNLNTEKTAEIIRNWLKEEK